MKKVVLVSGANGFVGSAVCRALLAARNWTPVALAREGADSSLLTPGVPVVRGEFHDRRSVAKALAEAKPEAVVHAAAVVSTGKPDMALSSRINVEGTRHFVDAAMEAGVRRWVQISSMSAHRANHSVYGGTKFLADEEVRRSDLAWTILRPSIIYGPARRGIFFKLVNLLRKLPVVPVVGPGREDMRPVHVDDLAMAVLMALDSPMAAGKAYMLGCAEAMTAREFFARTAAAAKGRPAPVLPLPIWLCRIIAATGEALLANPPITRDNIEGVVKAQPVEIADAERDLGFRPRSYDEGLEECLPQLLG
ncbi:MAG: NAD-dependent epimerase/dehydratase family protein [Candidatus Sumerlaeia bacterium]|nr:NAD-dependent epimerase/dehydratase family protein [Candidatus Sumerlaeia bacterium]